MLAAGAVASVMAAPAFPAGLPCGTGKDSTSVCVSQPSLRPVPDGENRVNLVINKGDTLKETFDNVVNEIERIETNVNTILNSEDRYVSEIDGDVVEIGKQSGEDVSDTSVVGLLGERLPDDLPPSTGFIGWQDGGWSWMNWPQEVPGDTGSIRFTPVTGAARGTLVSSNVVTVSGLDGQVSVSVVGFGDPRLLIDGASPVKSGTLADGQTLQVQLTSSAEWGREHRAVVQIGETSATFSVTSEAQPAYSFMAATGGEVETYGNYRVHTFFTSGRFDVQHVGDHPTLGNRVFVLSIGAGGGGGAGALDAGGGGGGAGGVILSTGTTEVLGYDVVVGTGGQGAATNALPGADGGDSVAGGVRAKGGGGGGSALAPTLAAGQGRPGASGGGGGSYLDGSTWRGAKGGNASGGTPGGEGSVRMAGDRPYAGGGGGGSLGGRGFDSFFGGSAPGGTSNVNPVPNFPTRVALYSIGGDGAGSAASRADGKNGSLTSFGGGGGQGPGAKGGKGGDGMVLIWYRFQ